ncbi:GNAT family N-acetyltransferase [Bosea sp. RCC_152_1]|uniref:GNAT family N-acetyltransferase n=1 Tax=Bosea sp. RCC_152_1 TaxID=3239228 RepID=UPI003524FAA8
MIETERLLLRRPSREDLDPIHAMRSDPEVVRFIGGKALSREEAWQRLTRSAGNWALLGYGFFAVVEKASGRLVGEAGLMQAHRGLGERFDPFPEAGWVFTREAQGRGYATEAALASHDWFGRVVGASRTVCIIAPENLGSMRVAAKLGYTPFGSACYHDATVTMLERPAE